MCIVCSCPNAFAKSSSSVHTSPEATATFNDLFMGHSWECDIWPALACFALA